MVEQARAVVNAQPSGPAGPADPRTEAALAEVLGELLDRPAVPVDAHFFTDLGANSLVMAHFCARLRKRPDLPSASMKDIYRHPTVAGLAAAIGEAEATATGSAVEASQAAPTPGEPARALSLQEAQSQDVPTSPAASPQRKAAYALCGAAQLLVFVAYSYAAALAGVRGFTWVSSATELIDTYLRSLLLGAVALFALCVLPVVAKWVLVGRWKPGDFPLWGFAYLRFWLVKVLLHANPMVFLTGNPLYVWYLRALGARIGPNVVILSHTIPVCTDLVTIGAGTVIRKDVFFTTYRAHDGRIQTGPVTLGRDVFVGEKSVLDIGTSMGDGSQLGHASALHTGQHVPAGARWHGSPAQPANVNYDRVPPRPASRARSTRYAALTVLRLVFLVMPLALGGIEMLISAVPQLDALLAPGTEAFGSSQFYLGALQLSLVVFSALTVVGLVVALLLPRILNLAIRPDTVYPLYGFHYAVHRTILRMTNLRFYNWLFGDSSFIVHYLKGLGYDLSRVEQTGSNFGTDQRHETPYFVTVGSGTMVADGLSIMNAEYSSTSFRVSQTTIGSQNFLGNTIAYPAGGRTGDNCLLATKVLVPLDGEVRENIGLLGSPSFEIPRTVERDSRFDHLRTGSELRRRLAAKNRYNLRTMAIFLVIRWVHMLGLTFIALAAVAKQGPSAHLVIAISGVLAFAFTAGYFILVERVIGRFRPLEPKLCSIYDPYFWWHERLWKVPVRYLNAFNGTPFKTIIWRLLGVRIGRRVFDDGVSIIERTLTTIGDECMLNTNTVIQPHSQEDGTFKSDWITLGDRCTLGVGAYVHYGTTLGDGAVLDADSFLMKGEQVPAGAVWGGNPATDSDDRRRPAALHPKAPQAAV